MWALPGCLRQASETPTRRREESGLKTYKGTPEINDFDHAGPVIVHDPEEKRGPRLYQDFKWAKIGRLPKGPWEMAEEEIRAWIAAQS